MKKVIRQKIGVVEVSVDNGNLLSGVRFLFVPHT